MGPAAAPILVGAAVVGAGAVAYSSYSGYKGTQAAKRAAQRQRELDQSLAIARNEQAQRTASATSAAAGAYASAQRKAASAIKLAAAQAAEIAQSNAILVEKEGDETASRKRKENRATEGVTRSRLWASGTLANKGSQKVFQKTLKRENKNEIKWIREAYKRQADVVREGGELQRSQLTAEAIGIGAGAAQTEAAGALAYAQIIFEGRQGLAAAGLGPDGAVLGRASKPRQFNQFGRFNDQLPQLPSSGGGATGGSGGTTVGGTPSLPGGFGSNR